MSEQLKHLVAVSKSPNISVRVIPLDSGERAGLGGPFAILEMPDPYPDVGYAESMAGRAFMEEAEDVDRFWSTYNELCEVALSETKSLNVIKSIAKELDS